MKRLRSASPAVFGILALLFVSSCSPSKEENAGKTGAKTPSKAIPAEVYLVKDTTISEQMRIVGSVVPNEEVQLVSEVSRKLTKILLKEGDYVRKGQVLFRLDDADLQARLKKLNAQRTFSAAAAERQARLLKIEGVSKQEYEQATSSLEAIDADIEMTRVEISKTVIRAPFAGKTGIRRVSEGAFVTQNTVMATVEDLSKVKIEFAVPEKYANGIKLNENITFRVENSSVPHQARILVIEPAIDQNTRSLFVRALADNKNGQLIPGSSAMVELELNKIQNAIMIPSQALISGLNGNSVWVVKAGKVAKTGVDIGFRTNRSVQIIRGLTIGDTLMTTNLLRAKPDLEVKVVKVTL
jgi:membrane fusion protein (multidrug efflux system)